MKVKLYSLALWSCCCGIVVSQTDVGGIERGGDFLVGIGKTDITGPVAGMGFMGFASPEQLGSGLLNRLYCRAFYLEPTKAFTGDSPHKGNNLAEGVLLIHTDIHSITVRLRQSLVLKLEKKYPGRLKARNILLHAQHTHSGPGGYHTSALYYVSLFGFSKRYFELLQLRIFQAVELAMAEESLFPARLFSSQHLVQEGGRNRSPEAFEMNPKWEKEAYREKYGDTKNTMMTVVRIFDTREKRNRGALSFFAVHPTSILNTNMMVSSDNKGYAEFLIEEQFNVTAAFFQTDAGDVSPNMVDTTSNYFRGEGRSFIEACEIIGERQAAPVARLLQSSESSSKPVEKEQVVAPEVGGRLVYVNFSEYSWHSGSSDAGTLLSTCLPIIGISFLAGTEDGRGIFLIQEGWNQSVVADHRFIQLKYALAEYISRLIVEHPSFHGDMEDTYHLQQPLEAANLRGNSRFAKVLGYLKEQVFRLEAPLPEADVHCHHPKMPVLYLSTQKHQLMPSVLPIQLLQLGHVFLAALPFEVTSMAGYRIRKHVQAALKSVSHGNLESPVIVEVLALSNGYASYLTTAEEYRAQHYEGAFTLFGIHQLHATTNILSSLVDSLSKPNASSSVGSQDELTEFHRASRTAVQPEALLEDEDISTVLQHGLGNDQLVAPPYLSSWLPLGTLYQTNFDKKASIDLRRLQSSLMATFSCAHPMHSQEVIDSFCTVERFDESTGAYRALFTDSHWNVRFLYKKRYLILHLCTCEWIPQNNVHSAPVETGRYRLAMKGAVWEEGEPTVYAGVSHDFSLLAGPGGKNKNEQEVMYHSKIDHYLLSLSDDAIFLLLLISYLLVRSCFRQK